MVNADNMLATNNLCHLYLPDQQFSMLKPAQCGKEVTSFFAAII